MASGIKEVYKWHCDEDGDFVPLRMEHWAIFTDSMPRDSFWMVTVQEWKDQRTLLQNNAFHGPVLTTLSKEMGYHRYRMKEILIHMFAPIDSFVDLDGEIIERRVRTSEMNIEQSTLFLNEILEWAAIEHGIVIDINPELRTSGLNPRIPDHEQPQWTKNNDE